MEKAEEYTLLSTPSCFDLNPFSFMNPSTMFSHLTVQNRSLNLTRERPLRASEALNSTRQNLEELRHMGENGRLTYESVYTDTLSHFHLTLISQDFEELLKLGWLAATHDNTSKPTPSELFQLATEATECLARQQVMVTVKWQEAVQFVLKLFEKYKESGTGVPHTHSPELKEWVLSVFNFESLCPNFDIRIQLLNIIQFWFQDGHPENAATSKLVVRGLYNLSNHLNAIEHRISPDNQAGLDSALFTIMYNLSNNGHLQGMYREAALQIKSLRVGEEARWLTSIVELVAARAKHAKTILMESNRLWNDSFRAMKVMKKSLLLLDILAFSSRDETCCYIGLTRVALIALIQVTSCILDIVPNLSSVRCNNKRKKRMLEEIIQRTVDMMVDMWFYLMNNPRSQSLAAVIRRNHIGELYSIVNSASKADIDMHYLLETEIEDTADCPERFTDGLTLSVMESPVFLQRAQMTVDETTLVYLLLQKSPQCPFTRTPLHHNSFSRLPDLQQEIHAWRTAGS